MGSKGSQSHVLLLFLKCSFSILAYFVLVDEVVEVCGQAFDCMSEMHTWICIPSSCSNGYSFKDLPSLLCSCCGIGGAMGMTDAII